MSNVLGGLSASAVLSGKLLSECVKKAASGERPFSKTPWVALLTYHALIFGKLQALNADAYRMRSTFSAIAI
eukprot:5731478-Pleurochrysis_carterae.AAC.2